MEETRAHGGLLIAVTRVNKKAIITQTPHVQLSAGLEIEKVHLVVKGPPAVLSRRSPANPFCLPLKGTAS